MRPNIPINNKKVDAHDEPKRLGCTCVDKLADPHTHALKLMYELWLSLLRLDAGYMAQLTGDQMVHDLVHFGAGHTSQLIQITGLKV